MNIMTESGERTRVSYHVDWSGIAPPPATDSRDPTVEPAGRSEQNEDDDDDDSMRIGRRLRLRPEASFNVDALLRQEGEALCVIRLKYIVSNYDVFLWLFYYRLIHTIDMTYSRF
jgi:hypothetical protein